MGEITDIKNLMGSRLREIKDKMTAEKEAINLKYNDEIDSVKDFYSRAEKKVYDERLKLLSDYRCRLWRMSESSVAETLGVERKTLWRHLRNQAYIKDEYWEIYKEKVMK